MTGRDYFFSDALDGQANIIACTPRDSNWDILLDRTLFHPKGGGQLSDKGWINNSKIIEVISHDSIVTHVVDAPLSIGRARIKIASEIRLLHSRLHSAGHLIGHVGVMIGLTPIKAQHWPGASSVSFKYEKEMQQSIVDFESCINNLINKDLARKYESNENFRAVSFGELPPFPCGGTHVLNLKEIVSVNILEIKYKKNALIISYDVSR